jgi:uncharacterized protein (DUF1810 family)
VSDPFDLERFVAAQAPAYDRARRELLAGRKTGHWIWFVFPQLAGLGRSPMAHKYAIRSLAEARAYLAHPVLGPRLVDCTEIVNAIPDRSLHEIFGYPDDLKFRSSMTLFAEAAPGEPAFRQALDKYCDAEPDPLTLELLGN